MTEVPSNSMQRRASTIRSGGDPSHRASSFTLIEILVVTVLLALAVGTLVLGLDGVTTQGRLRACANTIGGVDRLARTTAIASGLPQRVLFDTDENVCTVQQPEESPGGRRWSAGKRFALPEHTRIARLVVGDTATFRGETEAESIRIDAFGVSPSYACLLKSGEITAAVVIDGVTGTHRYVKTIKSMTSNDSSLLGALPP